VNARILYWSIKGVLLVAFGILFYDLGLSIAEDAVPMGPISVGVGVVVLLFLFARRAPRLLACLFPAVLVIGVGLNTARVLSHAPGGAWRIAPHTSRRILDLARNNPAPMAQTTFSLYYYMYDNLRGKRLTVYADSVFDEGFLKQVARIDRVEVSAGYPSLLTANAEATLRARAHEQFMDIDGREFIFVRPRDRSVDHETYVVLHAEDRNYVMAAAEAAEIRALP